AADLVIAEDRRGDLRQRLRNDHERLRGCARDRGEVMRKQVLGLGVPERTPVTADLGHEPFPCRKARKIPRPSRDAGRVPPVRIAAKPRACDAYHMRSVRPCWL